MTDCKPWEPLRIGVLESISKKVYFAEDFKIFIELNEAQSKDFYRLKSLITVGGDVSDFYRKSTVNDLLLKQHGIMHFHLGGHGSDALVYAIQYPDSVLFLRVDTHIHLKDVPVGKAISPLPQKKFEKTIKEEYTENKSSVLTSIQELKERIKNKS